VSPRAEQIPLARNIIKEFDLQESTIGFVGPSFAVGLPASDMVRNAWDLEPIAEQYEHFIRSFREDTPHSADDVLSTYLRMTHQWERLASSDPLIPEELNPRWVGHRAGEMYRQLREAWRETAHARWHTIKDAGVHSLVDPG
jgi:phenylacetic acid degradation operon negative regulatory protein